MLLKKFEDINRKIAINKYRMNLLNVKSILKKVDAIGFQSPSGKLFPINFHATEGVLVVN